MKKIICDRCGQEISGNQSAHCISKLIPADIDCGGGVQREWKPVDRQDLCWSCKQNYVRFVLNVLMENTGALNDDAVNSIIELFRSRDIRVKEVKE